MADYKLTVVGDGDVEYVAPAGSSFVRYKMPKGKAEGIIGAGKAEKSDKFPGFGISVGEYYFAGSMTAEKAEEKPKKKTTSKKK